MRDRVIIDDCFGGGVPRKREPVVLDAQGRNPNAVHIGLAAHEALTSSARTLFAPGPLVTLTDDTPRADSTLAWKFAHGPIGEAQGFDWFADVEPKS